MTILYVILIAAFAYGGLQFILFMYKDVRGVFSKPILCVKCGRTFKQHGVKVNCRHCGTAHIRRKDGSVVQA